MKRNATDVEIAQFADTHSLGFPHIAMIRFGLKQDGLNVSVERIRRVLGERRKRESEMARKNGWNG